MAEKTGIKETLEFSAFLKDLVEGVRKFKARGLKITLPNLLRSVGDFLPATLDAEDAFTDANLIPMEWADLSKEEAAKIMSVFNDGLELKDQLVEAEVEELFGATLNFFIALRNLLQKNYVTPA